MRVRDYLNPMHGWREASDVEKVRVYTRQSFLMIVAGVTIALTTQAVHDRDHVAVAAALVCAAATVVILRRTPRLGGTTAGSIGVPLIALGVATATLSVFGSMQSILWTAVLVTTAIAAHLDRRWSIAAVVGPGALAAALGATAVQAVFLGLSIAFMTATVRLSMWLLQIVAELDATRNAAAALSVAEERLRFARDLHDVVGRALSAIAVKSELAATLARRDDDRAAAQMDEVRALAHDFMKDARELVRGYRTIDVASEIVGARELLSSAGIRTELVGDVMTVPPDAAEPAAWVVREGVTNILRHSRATYCRMEFDVTGIRIVNDAPAPTGSADGGTGLSGLRERLTAVGGRLSVTTDSRTFALTAHFPSSEALP
ncbi:histidine kinase [Nakamurella sp. A5-74]|uniref:Histidine kinase n=1 Tax=Nakamurella sp. A5-74 TaxID=3158264 RepID=A0AAU8DM18_9ACTN